MKTVCNAIKPLTICATQSVCNSHLAYTWAYYISSYLSHDPKGCFALQALQSNISINIRPSDLGRGIVTPSLLYFGPQNYSRAQTVQFNYSEAALNTSRSATFSLNFEVDSNASIYNNIKSKTWVSLFLPLISIWCPGKKLDNLLKESPLNIVPCTRIAWFFLLSFSSACWSASPVKVPCKSALFVPPLLLREESWLIFFVQVFDKKGDSFRYPKVISSLPFQEYDNTYLFENTYNLRCGSSGSVNAGRVSQLLQL